MPLNSTKPLIHLASDLEPTISNANNIGQTFWQSVN